jgi:hypothetical protein
MRLSLLLFIVIILCIPGLLPAQDLMVKPYGVSPEDVKADTVGDPTYLGIRDIRFSGLENVGIGTKVYLKGTFVDSSLTSLVWNMYEVPATSGAALSAPATVDTASEVVTFIADLAGTYRISVSEGAYGDTVVINAATYGGVEGSPPNCSQCHSGTGYDNPFEEFEQTGHAHFLDNALEGLGRSGATCVPCHTTGWDTSATAANNGFDDFAFVYPDTQYAGMLDSMQTTYPDAMVRANIQCEACHGPGSNHNGATDDSKMVVSLDEKTCAYCHDDDHYHVYPSQWETSGHGSGSRLYPISSGGRDRSSCTPCHNGQGFIEWVKGKEQTATEEIPITCATCHDPHDATNEHQLRTTGAPVTLPGGDVITDGGKGKLCMNCHNSRRTLPDRILERMDVGDTPEPHHGPQAEMLTTVNVLTFDLDLPTSPHLQATQDACVDCHMFELGSHGEHDPVTHELNTSGMHSFAMVNQQGVDNVASCLASGCHSSFGDDFGDKRYYDDKGNADHDGDGIIEGLQHEVEGLLDTLHSVLPQDSTGEIMIMEENTDFYVGVAIYNYFLVEEDGSFGIHNPAFTVSLLQASIKAARGEIINSIETTGITPVEYELSQNYPNPFNPSTEIKFSITKPGHVTLKVFDMLGREVTTLINEEMPAGTYKSRFDASNLASGIYIYRIVSGNFAAIRKMVLIR